ncbi:hypothetical protein LWI28_018160 [Acer negundo]|uniref:Uncharacterized protein n=1 Tax=Acer negundo TaxID=4023 RepID=A0AAD5NW25_ACENE|nr:hypothetical protein LWI28_018160 [Acer negundo]
MSSRSDFSNKEEKGEPSFMMKAMLQQFKHMNVVFDEIRDRMDKQDAAIANLQEGRPQIVPNARRQERRELINDFDDNLGNEIEDEEDQVSMGDMDRFMQSAGVVRFITPALYGLGNIWFSVFSGKCGSIAGPNSMDPSPWLLHGGENNESLKLVMVAMDRMHAKSEEENDSIFHRTVSRLPMRRRNGRR